VDVCTHQAEAALRESEARFQAFMSHSPASVWIADRNNGRVLYLSPTYFRMFQFPQQDAVGKKIDEIYGEEFAQQFLKNNQRVFETQQVLETIETAPRADGSIGKFLVYKFPINNQNSEEMLLGGVAVDITEHKQAEAEREQLLQELTTARARFEAVLQQMPEGVIIADAASGSLILAKGLPENKLFNCGVGILPAQLRGTGKMPIPL
jgi:PAS domain S-box-containing protein